MEDILVKLYTFSMKLLILGGIAFFLEKIRPIQKIGFIKKDMDTEICFCLFNGVIASKYLVAFVIAYVGLFAREYLPRQIFNEEIQLLPFWIQILVALFILDLLTYIRHYFMHVFLWKFHAIHHTPSEINWITSYRLHPIEYLIAFAFQFLILYVIGFQGGAIKYALFILLAFNVYTHANLNFEFKGILRYIISCPNLHRWHHATDKEAINKNFTVVFPFIDLIFGTYYFPKGKLPEKYGTYNEQLPDGFINQMIYPFNNLIRRSKIIFKRKLPHLSKK